jgi:arginyl-tRNA synthetase
MVHRDPMLFFAEQVTSSVTRAMEDLSEEGWRDLTIERDRDTIQVASGETRLDIDLEMPPVGMGDFAFPCFQLTRFYQAPPNNVAFRLFPFIQVPEDLEPPILAGPYINFTVRSERMVEETLRSVLELGEGYGSLEGPGIRVVLEHTSANPNGPLHVGRARNPILGDTLARIMRLAGYDVSTEYYLNDMGRQIVLLFWGFDNRDPATAGSGDQEKVDHVLVKDYQRANKLAEDEPEINAEVRAMMSRLELGDGNMVAAVREPALLGLKGIQESLDRLGIHHDEVVSESQFLLDGSVSDVIDRLSTSEFLVEEEDGALALELESFGLQGRNTKFVFRRADGTSLYATRDLAYHEWKQRKGDLLINVLGEDHKLEAYQLNLALGIMGSDVKMEPVFYAFVSMPEGKMSTRAGRGVYLDHLMDEAVNRAREATLERRPELEPGDVEAIAEAVGLGAVRYNILRVQPEKGMVFRWEDALNFEGASAPFIQYSHTRACSILRKAAKMGAPVDQGLDPGEAAPDLGTEAEGTLVHTIARLPSVIDECARERKVHTLANYAERLASAFNIFYRDVPVLQAGEHQASRLLLVMAFRIAMNNSLRTLGIAAPEQM